MTAITRRTVPYGAYTLTGNVVAQGDQWVTLLISAQHDAQTGRPVEHPTMIGRELSFSTRDTTPLRSAGVTLDKPTTGYTMDPLTVRARQGMPITPAYPLWGHRAGLRGNDLDVLANAFWIASRSRLAG